MPNRYVCDALGELREILNKVTDLIEVESAQESKSELCEFLAGRFVFIAALIEEIQTYVNRMEAGLGTNWDLHNEQERLQKLKKKRRKVEKKLEELQEELEDLEPEDEDEEEEDENEHIGSRY